MLLSLDAALTDKDQVIAQLRTDTLAQCLRAQALLRILGYLGKAPAAPSFEAAAEALRDANAPAFANVPSATWAAHARALYDADPQTGQPTLSYDPKLRDAVAATMDMDSPEVSLWPLFEALGPLPMLLIHGKNSDILSVQTTKDMQERLPALSLLTLPDRTRLFTGHDYGPGGRPVAYLSTVGEQRRDNVHFGGATDERTFVDMRNRRDAELDAPALLDVAVTFNLSGGMGIAAAPDVAA